MVFHAKKPDFVTFWRDFHTQAQHNVASSSKNQNVDYPTMINDIWDHLFWTLLIKLWDMGSFLTNILRRIHSKFNIIIVVVFFIIITQVNDFYTITLYGLTVIWLILIILIDYILILICIFDLYPALIYDNRNLIVK